MHFWPLVRWGGSWPSLLVWRLGDWSNEMGVVTTIGLAFRSNSCLNCSWNLWFFKARKTLMNWKEYIGTCTDAYLHALSAVNFHIEGSRNLITQLYIVCWNAMNLARSWDGWVTGCSAPPQWVYLWHRPWIGTQETRPYDSGAGGFSLMSKVHYMSYPSIKQTNIQSHTPPQNVFLTWAKQGV